MVKAVEDVLRRTRWLYEAMYRFDAHAAGALGLHVTDLRCVNALEAGPLSAGEIGARLALTSGSVTALIGRLVAGGYVERVADEKDGRRARVALTPRFRTEANPIYGRLGAALAEAFGGATDAEIRTAALALERLAAGFEAAGGPDRSGYA